MFQIDATEKCSKTVQKETKKGQILVKGNPVSLYTEVLFASNSFINGTINLSFNITEYFLPQFPTLSAELYQGKLYQ